MRVLKTDLVQVSHELMGNYSMDVAVYIFNCTKSPSYPLYLSSETLSKTAFIQSILDTSSKYIDGHCESGLSANLLCRSANYTRGERVVKTCQEKGALGFAV